MDAPSSFTLFPDEIIDEIVQHMPLSDLLAFCRGDDRLHAICLPHIYGAVELTETGSLVQFCKTLRSRKALKALVKSLSINCHEDIFACTPRRRRLKGVPQFSPDEEEIRAACAAAISSLHNLVDLTLARPWSIIPLLPRRAFPQLRTLDITFSPHLAGFLADHPRITSLFVEPLYKTAQFFVQIPGMHLPALREYTGPEVVARAVLPVSSVTTITVYWDPPPLRQRLATECLSSLALSNTPVTTLRNIINGWQAPSPLAIAQALPRLEILEFLNLRRDSSPEQRAAFLRDLAVALPLLPRLTTLVVHEPGHDHPNTPATFKKEWSLLKHWYSLCPTLTECMLLSGTRWERWPEAPMKWVPVRASDEFYRWFGSMITGPDGEWREI
ncbi:hypothetical protein DFH09DRAFT_1475376 [Mycena vulgaris]|nr:hypothetical protein DFH09DRAFT_1475376 [Mycena vulgaris]